MTLHPHAKSIAQLWAVKLVRAILTMLLLVTLWGIGSHPASALDLTEGTDAYSLGPSLSYFEDKTGAMSLEAVNTPPTLAQFVPNSKEALSLGFTRSAYWFKLDLHNRNSRLSEWLLESQYPPLDRIDVYVIRPGQAVQVSQGGRALPFALRAIKHRNVVFSVALARGESATLLVRVKTESSLQVALKLWSTNAFLDKDHGEQYLLGLYYGVLVAMFLYNLLIYFLNRETSYLYYVLYILNWAFLQMSINGMAFEYLWPQYPGWSSIALPFFIGSTYSFIILFAKSFLQTERNLPRFNRVLQLCLAAFVVVMAMAFGATYALAIEVGTLCALATTPIVLAAGVVALRHQVRQAKYFVLAWVILLGGIFLYTLKTFGVLPSTPLTDNGMQIGSVLEVILLSFAMAHKMRLLREDNERIQREATDSLEQNVKQRTLELDQAMRHLSAANAKLTDLSHIDALTGVWNRAYFNERFDAEWRLAQRGEHAMALLMVDIDHFKSVNDRFGHQGGDACLKRVAHVIVQTIQRAGDAAFRYGGEEFAVILSNADAKGAAHLGEMLRHAVQALDIEFEGQKIQATISVGVASMVPHSGNSADSPLIGAADRALYQAKRQGRNQVCIAEDAPRPLP